MTTLSQDMLSNATLKQYGLNDKTFDLSLESHVAVIGTIRFFSKLTMNDSSVLADIDKGYAYNLSVWLKGRGVSDTVAIEASKIVLGYVKVASNKLLVAGKSTPTNQIKYPVAKLLVSYQKNGTVKLYQTMLTLLSTNKTLRFVERLSKTSSVPHTSAQQLQQLVKEVSQVKLF